MLMQALVLLVGLVQIPADSPQAAAINAAKRVMVQTIDASLPRIPFETWLRDVAGASAAMDWEANDCGEQTGSAADAGRDFPICAEVQVSLGGQKELHLSLAVGTIKKGVGGAPQFFDAYVRTANGNPKSIRSLAAVPAAIRAN